MVNFFYLNVLEFLEIAKKCGTFSIYRNAWIISFYSESNVLETNLLFGLNLH